ncbi:unnamed protein product [Parajaminaea phylloscopi]
MSTGAQSQAPDLTTLPILLPLLRAPDTALHALRPPLHELPGNQLHSSRIVHTQKRKGKTSVHWVATNHTYPAAYPRSHPASTCPPCQPYPYAEPAPLPRAEHDAKSEEKRRRQVDLAEWKRRRDDSGGVSSFYPPASEEEACARAEELAAKAFPQLWATAQRIVPVVSDEPDEPTATAVSDESPSYTLVLSHANGMHKETWHEMLRTLLDKIAQDGSIVIDEVWSLDVIGAGESGSLNRSTMGETLSWFDGARDLRQFLEHYLPPLRHGSAFVQSVGPGWPSSTLPRVSGRGTRRRKLIGVGHSFSGTCFSMLAASQPDLLDAVVLIDPVIYHPDNFLVFAGSPYEGLDNPVAKGAVVRRDVWANRGAARQYFLSRPFFQAWHTDVLESYVRHALRSVSSAPDWVTLATSKWTETALFASHMGIFALAALRFGRFNGKIHHFYVENTVQEPKDTEAINSAVANLGGSHEKLGGGHLIVQEQPQLMGEKLADALRSMLAPAQTSERRPLPRPRL